MPQQPLARWWSSVPGTGGLDTGALRDLSVDYWRRSGALAERLGWYVAHLLPHELAHAEARGALQFPPCHTLALLVGHSIEPLLQAVSVFQPQRVLLVLSEWYDRRDVPDPQRGEEWGREVAALIGLLPGAPAVDLCEVPDQPDAVFQGLCDQVLDERQAGLPVVVDISGGKKSMVAGAFLFAAYADIPISYVNFDTFDEAMRRPLGFTCRIGTLTNPYDAFRLRAWERVRRLYTNYHFRAAAEVLEDILASSSFRPEQSRAAQSLVAVLRFYKAWGDGDYRRARELLPHLKARLPSFSPPLAVDLLGEQWPNAGKAGDAESMACNLLAAHDRLRLPPYSLFDDNDLLVTYARDELAKIERLVEGNEDNRSALLRAAGLDELLLKARLVRLWHRGWIDVWDGGENHLGRCRSLQDAELAGKLYEALIEHHGTDHMRRTLQGNRKAGWSKPAFVRLDTRHESYRVRPTAEVPLLADYERETGLSGQTLTQLRNQAIHMYLYVTQPVAEAALALARANLDEFETRWAPLAGPVPPFRPADVERIPWDDVCQMCQLSFLPVAAGPHEGTISQS